MFKTSFLKLMLLALVIPTVVLSQVTKDLPNYFPVSPNAAAFAKEGLFPVDYYTGKININIPIYNIKTKELTVPIDINYNSAGIQLDELASWVGLGWNLNAGGAVVRNVKGIPDNGIAIPNIVNSPFTSVAYNILYNQYNPYWTGAGGTDSAYDEFIVNAPGLSGTFYFVNNKAIFRDLQNTVVKTSSTNNGLYGNTQTLEITKNDGTIYRFGQGLDGYNANEITHNTSDINKADYIATWYLTEIIPPNSKNTGDIIYFKYKLLDNTSDYAIIIGEQLADNNISPNITPSLKSIFPERTSSNKQFLTAINFKNGIVEFSSALDRQDLIEDYKLDKISVFSLKGITKTLIQEYGFVYDYYIRSGGYTTTDPMYYTTIYPTYNNPKNLNGRNKSLRLLQLTNNILNTKHVFEYENTPLPLRGTTKKDYWGYINNNTGNLSPPTLISRISELAQQNFTVTVGNGNRLADEVSMKSGILQKITYPEGGYSIFEYEANRYTENVTTTTTVSKTATVVVYGPGCNSNYGPSTKTTTFTIPSTYVSGSGKLDVFFSPATQESGGNTNVKFDTETFLRPAPFTSGSTTSYVRNFSVNNHTLNATEYRSGNIGAYGCPWTSITASWKENSGTTTTPTIKYIGGLRIKSVKSYDGLNTNPVYTKLYQYENENVLVKEGNGSYVRGVFGENRKSDVLPIFSTSAVFDNNTGGSPAITYGKVIEIDSNTDNTQQNGKTEYFYENIPLTRLFDIDAGNLPTLFKNPSFNISLSYNIGLPINSLSNFGFYKNDLWNQGSLLKTNFYKTGTTPNTYKLIRSIVNQYSILKQSTLSYNIVFNNYPSQVFPGEYLDSFNQPYDQTYDFHSGMLYYMVGQTSQGKKEITTTTETEYDDNENPTNQKVTTYSYENPLHYQLTKTETVNSKNETLKTQLSYPQDLVSTGQITEMQGLINQNKIDKPIKKETFVNNVQTSESITKYEQSTATGNLLLPKEIHSSKGLVETFPFNNTNRKINFTLYDTDVVGGVTLGNGNVLEYSLENGTPVSIIWGYNKSQPIAKIENAAYSQVSSYAANLQNLSNTGTEADLITALNALRTALPNAMVTTYTYLPLVGVSTITDPKGDKIIYTYDSAGRLQFVKDAQGNLISENQYHYKN